MALPPPCLGFEYRPDLKGIKTRSDGTDHRVHMFEYRPDLKGIKTTHKETLHTAVVFEYRPDLKGIKTLPFT